MNEEFLNYMAFCLKWEGETYEEVVGDSGGGTKYGIDAKDHPNIDIPNLTKDQAIQIYWQEYLSSRSSLLSAPARWVYFDSVVNMGEKEAIIILQHCIGTDQDGIWGKNTQQAEQNVDPRELSYKLIDRRNEVYHLIAAHRDNQKFLAGWLNRDEDLRALVPQL